MYGALPVHHEDEEPSRAPGQPPNWQPKHTSPSTRIYGPPPRRLYTNRSSAESDADVLDLRVTKRRRVEDDDEELVRCALIISFFLHTVILGMTVLQRVRRGGRGFRR